MVSKFGMLVVVVAAFVLGCGGVKSPTPPETDVGVAVEDTPDAGVDQPEVVPEPEDAVPEATADDGDQQEEVVVLQTLAEKFVAAGGQKLCLAMVAALNPDWRMDTCRNAQPGPNGEDRKTECENQRRPLAQFAEDVCKTVIEESLRLDLDPGMVLAVIERESSFGRASWSQQDRAYEVQTDVCHLTLPLSRIVERKPGRRAGTETMTWIFGSQAPNAGAVARNRQPVIVESETDTEVVLNTCAAGERGIMQTTSRELHVAGDAIGMTGTMAQRGAALEADPILQVRLGCQALAEHRALLPVDQQTVWPNWIHSYNTGTVSVTDHGREYRNKIIRHYLAACRGWMLTDESDPTSVKNVEDVWTECGWLEEMYNEMRDIEAASGRE
jgi:hypothetical protein